MLDSFKDSVSSLGSSVAERSVALARRIGPKRGITALGIIAAAIGASFVVRYVKQRRAEPEIANPSGGAPTKKQRRKARRHAEHAQLG